MCRFISFHHNPISGDVVVSDLESHSDTEEKLKLNLNVWREGHYLPNGEVELRLCDNDRVDTDEYKSSFLKKYPTFASFFKFALRETNQEKKYKGSLDVRGCDLKGIKLPENVEIIK